MVPLWLVDTIEFVSNLGRQEVTMSRPRPVLSVTETKLTMEGAGVRLNRAFGRAHERLDPFLLLDDFGSENPDDYLAGFPWHPHRGIETITYILEGEVRHGDSLGNSGTIRAGDVQWMTAGSGIVHEEMPLRSTRLRGFQLWANLPSTDKMMCPRYQDVTADSIPTAQLAEGVEAKVICGTIGEVEGPVQDIVTEPRYLDVSLSPHKEFSFPLDPAHNSFAYVIEGDGRFGTKPADVGIRQLVTFGEGDSVEVKANGAGLRFLLVSGKPIREPVAWGGPIVMNTQNELSHAFSEYRSGEFIKEECR